MRLYSYKDRPMHNGSYPLERLPRQDELDSLSSVPPMKPLSFRHDNDENLTNAMRPYAAMLDAIRDGASKKERGELPQDLQERSNHLKSFAYYQDASMVGVCELSASMFLDQPITNPAIKELSELLRTKQTSTLAAGIDVVMAELRETMVAPPKEVSHHSHALVFLYEYPRDPKADEPGCEWLIDTQAERASVRAAETAIVVSNYIRLLGYEARGHTGSSSDVDLNKLAVASGLAYVKQGPNGPSIYNPYLDKHFGIGAITTNFELAADKPLKPVEDVNLSEKLHSHGPAWLLGKGFAKNAFNHRLYKKRNFKDGAYPFETIKRIDKPTTFIDEQRVPRVPKRTDMFARAIFGDMGKNVQEGAKNGNYVRKSAASFASRRSLAAFVLLQDGEEAETISSNTHDSQRNADNIKAALYFLGADAVGISRCPDWTYYSHNALGDEITPYHNNAISMVVDQGHETMEGASGDDWIACSQSMRAYLRFSLLGSIISEQIRRLGYSARSHTVLDGEVLQPPLLLLSGLGEVSRIGEVILNPYLGPRLKSGVITTNMPLAHDKPIDFGLQNFCNNCNKCARECPSGAITAGPKKMFNGYEIWKSDSQKCTQYRITQPAGAMCGRCMKTCPWNLEGLFAEAPFRWAASNIPSTAKWLAGLDDKLGNGNINPVKKWWWDLEMTDEGPYTLAKKKPSARELQLNIELKHKDQTLAVYPANLAPAPYPYPSPMDREAGIKAFEEMISAKEYKARLAANDTKNLAHEYKLPEGESPVLRVEIITAEKMNDSVTKFEFASLDGSPLPEFDAGGHIDVVVAPEFLRQYSLSGDPSDRSKYQIGVLREDEGRGGSALLHRIFTKGRKVFISRPANHFPLEEQATKSYLMGGGIGVTPMIAMAHRLHALGKDFELRYSCSSREGAGFLDDLKNVPWVDKVHLHFSSEKTRVDLDALFAEFKPGNHVYTCGPERYMDSVIASAEKCGWPDESIHKEYFSVPEESDFVNHEFTVELKKSGKTITVPEDRSAAEAILDAGIHVDVKCADGICGVCSCGYTQGKVEHRDYVLSNKQREDTIILCRSRAAEKGGVIELDL